MEVAAATATSFTTLRARTSAIIPSSTRKIRCRGNFSSSSSLRASLSNGSLSSYTGGSISSDFCGAKLPAESLNLLNRSCSKPKRGVITMVTPFKRESGSKRPPPDLASYLFRNRIVYLGMSLVPSVTELLVAEFLFLQYEDLDKPIYLYINSTGTTKGGQKLAYETEAFAIYDAMGYIKAPIYTLCVGNAWGEAALLLTAGAKGNRSALPSTTMMIKEPIARFQGQASDVQIASKEVKSIKSTLVKLFARHIGKSPEQIEADMKRPKYFSPSEAVEYGLIDKVVYNERTSRNREVVSELKDAELI